MKITFIITLLSTLLLGTNTYAQKNTEKMKVMKVGFLTEALSLSADEAQNFWPLYNAYEAEKSLLRKNAKAEFKNIEAATEDDASRQLDLLLGTEEKLLNLKKGLVADLKKHISVKKISLLFQAERKFKSKLLDKVKSREKGKRRNGRM